MTAGADVILSLRGVTKAFAGLKVVTDVGFEVPRGQRMALIGPNGAGKTTIFNLISGVFRLDEGAILLQGADIARRPAGERAAMGLARSFQNIRLMPHLSVVENVMVGQHVRTRGLVDLLTPLWLPRNRIWAEEAEARLRAFGLDTYPNVVTANLPYGIRKKIEVVRALMSRPKVLLLDEPAAGLNPAETSSLRDFLMEVAAEGVTLLVVEHDMAFVRSLCERTVVLNFGRKIYDGPTAGVQDDPGVLEAYLGRRSAKGKDAAAAALAEGSIHAS
ncbi:MAG TPA: ABC transporter ATP-binding protein [Hyphomicrobiales bacterium]|nr:ABC transporter ATP-binding protein [Hyphomicrobiales bacterium]